MDEFQVILTSEAQSDIRRLDGAIKKITILKVGHRREIYKP